MREADVSYQDGKARVKYNEHSIGAGKLRQVIEQVGYTAGEVG